MVGDPARGLPGHGFGTGRGASKADREPRAREAPGAVLHREVDTAHTNVSPHRGQCISTTSPLTETRESQAPTSTFQELP
jgi:hypothetical protein